MRIVTIIFCFLSTLALGQVAIHSRFSGNSKAGGKGVLEVSIQKKHINSFAKYQVEFPNGISISEGDSKGGNFSIEGNKAKIVWINLPQEENYNITLKVNFTDNVQFPVTLYQKFYYLENSVKKEISAEPMVINSSEISISLNTNTSGNENTANKSSLPENKNNLSEKKQENAVNQKAKEENTLKENKKEEKAVKEIKKEPVVEKKETITGNKNTGLVYKIQVAASAVKPSEQTYSSAEFEIVQHNGMYKVITKKEFFTKEEALQYREQLIQKGYSGAFLVKYQNGQRVN